MIQVTVDMSLPENQNPQPNLEPGEFIETFTLPLTDLYDECVRFEREGCVIDARVGTLAQGVEFALVVVLVLLKVMNVVEMTVAVCFDSGVSRRGWLECSAAGVFAAAGVLVLTVSLRNRRVQSWAVAVDVVAGVTVLLAAPGIQYPCGWRWL